MTPSSELSFELVRVAQTRVKLPSGPAPTKTLIIRVKADAAAVRDDLSRVSGSEYGDVLNRLGSILLRLIYIAQKHNQCVPDPLTDWPEPRRFERGEAATQLSSLYDAVASLCQELSENKGVSHSVLKRAFRALVSVICALGLERSDLARVTVGTASPIS